MKISVPSICPIYVEKNIKVLRNLLNLQVHNI